MKKVMFILIAANMSYATGAFFLAESLGRRFMHELSNSFAAAEERSQLLHRFQVMNERVRKRVAEVHYTAVEEYGLGHEFVQYLDQIRQGKFTKVLETLDTYPLFARGFSRVGDNGKMTSPLHHAVLYGQHAIVRELIARGAGVNNSDEEGRTALHIAVLYQQRRLIQTLLVNGAYVGKSDAYDKDPITYAMEAEEMVLTRLIFDHMLHNGDHEQLLNLIVPHCILRSRKVLAYREYFYYLVNHPLFNCDAQNMAGCMPIHIAVVFECTDVFNMLLAAGAWCDAQNRAGCSALMEAARYYRLTRRGRYMIERLLFLSLLSLEDTKKLTAQYYLELLEVEGLEFLRKRRKYESQCKQALSTIVGDILPQELHALICKMLFGKIITSVEEPGWWKLIKELLLG